MNENTSEFDAEQSLICAFEKLLTVYIALLEEGTNKICIRDAGKNLVKVGKIIQECSYIRFTGDDPENEEEEVDDEALSFNEEY